MSKILNSLKNISTNSINKLKEMRNTHNCGVCHKLINSNLDDNVMYSDTLQGWFHNECLNTLPRCNSCDNASFHLESGICSRCMNCQSIRSYSYRPNPIFHRVNNKKKSVLISDYGVSKYDLPILHFGVEIEVDRHNDYDDDYDDDIIIEGNNFASLVNIVGRSIKNSNLFYSKSDSSLTEQGVEVVSHPFSWNFWKTFGRDMYDGLFSALLASGYHSDESKRAGMHIHVSKASINKTQLHKLLWFIYESPNLMNVIAQRTSDRWASLKWSSLLGEYGKRNFATKRNLVASISNRKYSKYADRYTAVNLQPDNTIELRMFNGTLNIMTLSKSIEFIHSLLNYCTNTSFKDIVNRHSEPRRIIGYLNFLSQNQKRYPNLCIFLDRELNQLSDAKKNKFFGDAKKKVSRKLLLDGLSNTRTANSFNLDKKGMIL